MYGIQCELLLIHLMLVPGTLLTHLMLVSRDAEDAAADLDGKSMNGDRIRVELAYTPR